MKYDVSRIRKYFPALESGIAFFDGPGGSQVPKIVGDRMAETITSAISNRGLTTSSEITANEIVMNFRQAAADLVDGHPQGVVFGRSWTQLSYDFSRNISKMWSPGDEVIVTRIDHDSNVRPWIQAAERVGAIVKWAEFDLETGELPVSAIAKLISSRTRLVAVTGASNVLGTRPDLAAISKVVHSVGALFFVDGVHLTPHAPVSMKEIGADFFGFSAYKLLGPHCGVLLADPALLEAIPNEKLKPSSAVVPERFEFGTLPYELLAGVSAAIDFIADLVPSQLLARREKIVASMSVLEEYEQELFEYMESQLLALRGVKSYGHAAVRTPTLFFTFEGVDSTKVYQHLAGKKVNVPVSNFYALEASVALGLGEGGALRAGLAAYSTHDDVDRLISGIEEVVNS